MAEAAVDNWQPIWNAQVSISTPICVNFELCPGSGNLHISWFNFYALALVPPLPTKAYIHARTHFRGKKGTVKPVYNDHLMGYFSAFWSSCRWPYAIKMSSRRQKLLARVNWYCQSSLKHATKQITGKKFYHRGGHYRQVSLYFIISN